MISYAPNYLKQKVGTSRDLGYASKYINQKSQGAQKDEGYKTDYHKGAIGSRKDLGYASNYRSQKSQGGQKNPGYATKYTEQQSQGAQKMLGNATRYSGVDNRGGATNKQVIKKVRFKVPNEETGYGNSTRGSVVVSSRATKPIKPSSKKWRASEDGAMKV